MTESHPTDPVHCARCGQTAPGVENPPYPKPLADELEARVCRSCWAEWLQLEVMVINELQLNFMDPRSLEILIQHMREFLVLDKPADDAE